MAYRYPRSRKTWRRDGGGGAELGALAGMLWLGWLAAYPGPALTAAGILAGALVLYGIVALALALRRTPEPEPEPVRHSWSQYIQSKAGPMTAREWDFYRLLENWARRQGFRILANCNLYAVMRCDEDGSAPAQLAWHKIKAKQIDFTCVDARGATVWCLELDDHSHDRPGARERDADKDEAFGAAGIPFYRTRDVDRLPAWTAQYERPRWWRAAWDAGKVWLAKRRKSERTGQGND